MKERPILFSGELVRAILDGRKTQTRRVYQPRNPAPYEVIGERIDGAPWPLLMDEYGDWYEKPCPYGAPGDRLYVRETWRVCSAAVGEPVPVEYRSDAATVEHPWPEPGRVQICAPDKWSPSIHMPRWASRIDLEVTGVRVERVQDITEHDAIAEGVEPFSVAYNAFSLDQRITGGDGADFRAGDAEHRASFAVLWDEINAERDFGWASNPWVWVVAFRVAEVRRD